jgi:hypothetical protein
MDAIRMTQVTSPVNGYTRISNKRSAKIAPMKKDTRLTFRVTSNLKRDIEAIATREGQSAARICEAFIVAGSDAYRKQGTKFLQPLLGRLGTKSVD